MRVAPQPDWKRDAGPGVWRRGGVLAVAVGWLAACPGEAPTLPAGDTGGDVSSGAGTTVPDADATAGDGDTQASAAQSSGDSTGAASSGIDGTGSTSTGATKACGNGVVDPGEDCDDDDLAGQTCRTLGFDSGELRCRLDCEFNTNQCEACGVSSVPAPGGCPGACDSCAEGTCVIDCAERGATCGGLVVCPLGLACQVNCIGDGTCADATILCPNQYDCSVTCEGGQACGGTSIDCGNNGLCTVACVGAEPACEGTDVACGDEACSATCDAGAGAPTFGCGSACDCQPCP